MSPSLSRPANRGGLDKRLHLGGLTPVAMRPFELNSMMKLFRSETSHATSRLLWRRISKKWSTLMPVQSDLDAVEFADRLAVMSDDELFTCMGLKKRRHPPRRARQFRENRPSESRVR
jgi:hypothetical protein